MCCIFTCCGWMIDLLQRVWAFSMSCIIMTAVIGVVSTAAMSGIALGYNYSLAEYIDLKETNVSVYLKRGVFDDEIADDMSWRRAGHLPIAGQIRDDNLMTGAPDDEISSQRSGRRLDDSVFDANDHHNYEGSLMKLTAKSLDQSTLTDVTSDIEMAESVTKYPMGSLDQMKAIQSLIDSRRAMATGGSTISPIATYESGAPLLPFLPAENNPNMLMNPEVQYRRMMEPPSGSGIAPAPPINPARFAVPSLDVVNDRINWVVPKHPEAFVISTSDYFYPTLPTYPTAVTVRPMLVRPTAEVSDGIPPPEAVSFPYPSSPTKVETTQPPPLRQSGQEHSDMDQKPDFYNEKVLMEGDEMSKAENQYNKQKLGSWGKSPEQEYEDEIRGLPVRKRRSIMDSAQVGEGRNPAERNNTRNNGNINSFKNIFTSQTTSNEIGSNYEDIFTINKNISIVEVSNDSKTAIKISHKDNTIQQMDANEKGTLDLENKLEIISKHDRNENKKGQSLLKYLVKSIEEEAILVAETAPNAGLVKSTAEDIRINTKISSFESKIVPTKYVSNNLATRIEKKQPFNNKGILNSISVGLKK